MMITPQILSLAVTLIIFELLLVCSYFISCHFGLGTVLGMGPKVPCIQVKCSTLSDSPCPQELFVLTLSPNPL